MSNIVASSSRIPADCTYLTTRPTVQQCREEICKEKHYYNFFRTAHHVDQRKMQVQINSNDDKVAFIFIHNVPCAGPGWSESAYAIPKSEFEKLLYNAAENGLDGNLPKVLINIVQGYLGDPEKPFMISVMIRDTNWLSMLQHFSYGGISGEISKETLNQLKKTLEIKG